MNPVAGRGSPYRNTGLHVQGRKDLKGAVEEKTIYIQKDSSLTWNKILQAHNKVLFY